MPHRCKNPATSRELLFMIYENTSVQMTPMAWLFDCYSRPATQGNTRRMRASLIRMVEMVRSSGASPGPDRLGRATAHDEIRSSRGPIVLPRLPCQDLAQRLAKPDLVVDRALLEVGIRHVRHAPAKSVLVTGAAVAPFATVLWTSGHAPGLKAASPVPGRGTCRPEHTRRRSRPGFSAPPLRPSHQSC
jgi:hypothetical protein